jgi:large subunit ribosomal protein L17
MRSLCAALIESGRITTTEARAKELRRWVERLVTTAKAGDVHARREVAKDVPDPVAVAQLFENVVPKLQERPGGYTRIIRKGPRLGDAAPMVVIEFVS